jgi:hypothetical protein
MDITFGLRDMEEYCVIAKIDWRCIDFACRRLYQSLGCLVANVDLLELVSATDEEIARDYDEVNVQEIVRTIRKFKREKRGRSMFPYRSQIILMKQ